MTVRAKLQLQSETKHSWGGKTLGFACQYDASIPDDQRFMKATPTGSLNITIDNPAAIEQFQLGKYYYIDFVPMPEGSA